ncbi:HlyD family efflux transporter periplasmic adaptor subunit [Symplocastrum sp. BBK-W-15]|uniref:HlyD family efflux transporter periplasmic adaptor subunit n=2 Tax=Limnofasciculus TaxID=3064905 RepID=A0AAE3GX77_9CYAN|nr:HlyD family efflux transporter periplasmic adaptor subunit [Limnofasciculus baicalensis BBK-W-15]
MGQIPDLKDQPNSKSVTHWVTKTKAFRFTIPIVVGGILATGVAAIYTLKYAQQRPTELSPSPSLPPPAIKSVTALGRLEPAGEVIQVSAPSSLEGARVQEILVNEGDWVRANQVIAVLDNRDRLQSDLDIAQKQVKIAQANLNKVKAGAKPGTINAQTAKIGRLGVESQGEKDARQTNINSLETQLIETQKAEDAKIQAQEKSIESKQAAIESQKAIMTAQVTSVNRLKEELDNAEEDFERYPKLAADGTISESEFKRRSLGVKTARGLYEEAQANLSQAQANLSQARANLSQEEAKLIEIQANKTQTLATLREKRTEAKVNRKKTEDVFQGQIKEEEATLEEIKEVRPVDVQQAEAEVERALAGVQKAQTDLKSLAYVDAKEAGQILKINKRPGAIVEQGKPIVEMGKTDQMIAIAEVYESDISKVRIGQRVTINSEGKAFSGELHGNVREIGLKIGKKDSLSTDPAADVDSRVVEVKIRLRPEDNKRVAGLTFSKVIVEIFL